MKQSGGYPEDQDKCGRTALHYAIYSGKDEVLELLTRRNREIIKMQDHAGRTALHHAVFMDKNQVRMSQKLIELGADVNALDKDKRTPLHHAAEEGKIRVIPILMNNGAIVSLRDGHTNKNPMELACSQKVREEIKAHSNIDIDIDDWQPEKQEAKKKEAPRKEEPKRYQELPARDAKRQEFTFAKQPKDVQKAEAEILAKDQPSKESLLETVEKDRPKKKKKPVAEPANEVTESAVAADLQPVNIQTEKDEEEHVPFQMKQNKQKLLELLKRIQSFGVESFIYQKKPYLYSGSWMEYVQDLDGLMLQINGTTPNEACMKIFNVLFPYPKPLPAEIGDESTLNGFFDGIKEIDKGKQTEDCHPRILREKI